jgi:hypothetical protein
MRTSKIGSFVAAISAFLILSDAIRSCITMQPAPPRPGEVILARWHHRGEQEEEEEEEEDRDHRSALRMMHHPSPSSSSSSSSSSSRLPPPGRVVVGDGEDEAAPRQTSDATKASIMSEGGSSTPPPLSSGRRRLKRMYSRGSEKTLAGAGAAKVAPDDLKRLHKRMRDPRTTERRDAMPLDANTYKLDPLIKPDGYPWHRWSRPPDNNGGYALNTAKFVNVLSRLGNGEDELGTVTPNQYTVGGAELAPDTVRLGTKVRPYIIRNGTVLRPGGRTGMFVTFVQRAVEMAVSLSSTSPRMRLLSEGDLPLMFDANDYPWCGDDLVPVFRLNAIARSSGGGGGGGAGRVPRGGVAACEHAWPAMSLTYFSDPTNVQLAESPYEWDGMMAGWDATYGAFDDKISKLVWRGRITGYTYRDGERPRQNLIRYSRDFLDIMDVKPSTKKSLIKQDDFQMYKAILDIDGNAWSARLGKLLCYNSVVIKVEPEYVGYWEVSICMRGSWETKFEENKLYTAMSIRVLSSESYPSSLTFCGPFSNAKYIRRKR